MAGSPDPGAAGEPRPRRHHLLPHAIVPLTRPRSSPFRQSIETRRAEIPRSGSSVGAARSDAEMRATVPAQRAAAKSCDLAPPNKDRAKDHRTPAPAAAADPWRRTGSAPMIRIEQGPPKRMQPAPMLQRVKSPSCGPDPADRGPSTESAEGAQDMGPVRAGNCSPGGPIAFRRDPIL